MTNETLWRELGVYEAGRADAQRLDSIFGKSGNVFWTEVYTTTICWLKTALLLSRAEHPSRQMTTKLVAEPGRLGTLVEKVRSAAATDIERLAAERLQTWFNTTWLGMAKAVQQSVGHHAALLSHCRA